MHFNFILFKRTLRGACIMATALSIPAVAQSAAPAQNSAPIRIWGHGHRGQDYIQTLLTAWESGFRSSHPEANFEDTLYGNASGIGSLFTGVGDLAIMDREASFIEHDAFLQGAGYKLFGIPVAQGAVSIPHHARALVVYVNRSNPLTEFTMEQLDGIFDADHRLTNRRYKTWGDLGLIGEWASRPIQIYSYEIVSSKIQFFESAAVKGSQKFSCGLTVFHDGPGLSAEQQIGAALKKNKYGVALSAPIPGLKAVALAKRSGEPPVLATEEAITAGMYPLARTVYIYVNRKPGSPVSPKVAAFLEYIVSPEGQAIVAHTGGYLPLSANLATKAKELLQ